MASMTEEKATEGPYGPSRYVASIDGCYFYHATDLPGLGSIPGDWDLRPGIDSYLGGVDFRGKRVLDVGSASGFLSFEMERRGAEVVSYDLSPSDSWDAVPFSGVDRDQTDALMRGHLDAINAGYWLSHRLKKSSARLARGTVYDIPQAVGPVDVAVYGAILLHLRDPFRALFSGLRLVRETVVVTDMLPGRYRFLRHLGDRFGLPMFLMPRAARKHQFETWWILSPATVCEFLRILGFEDLTVSYHHQLFKGQKRLTYTVVGRRTGPVAERI